MNPCENIFSIVIVFNAFELMTKTTSLVSHQKMRNHCLDYITTVKVSPAEVWKTTSGSTKGLVADAANLSHEKYPFLQYAVRNVLLHADAAAEHGLS
jgi:hypothetical protein